MFSAGNITEKLRVAKFDCRGETVVDLYAGSKTMLMHASNNYLYTLKYISPFHLNFTSIFSGFLMIKLNLVHGVNLE